MEEPEVPRRDGVYHVDRFREYLRSDLALPDVADFSVRVADFGGMLEHLEEAERLAREIDDHERLARASAFLTNHFTVMMNFTRAIHHGRQALDLARATGNRSVEVTTNAYLAVAYYTVARYADAAELRLEAGVDQAIAIGDPYGRWLRTGGLAEAYLLSGRADEAMRLARRAVDLTRLAGSAGVEVHATILLGETLLDADPRTASEHLASAIARADEFGMMPGPRGLTCSRASRWRVSRNLTTRAWRSGGRPRCSSRSISPCQRAAPDGDPGPRVFVLPMRPAGAVSADAQIGTVRADLRVARSPHAPRTR